MTSEEEATKLIRLLRDEGFDVGHCCVVTEGVFFPSRTVAVSFAERYGREVVELAGVSGWLVKNPPAV
jgi:hypothetical protein